MRCSLPAARTIFARLALTLMLWATAFAAVAAGVSPFMSPSFSRTIHGDKRSLDLVVGGRQWGTAGAFAGVESLSSASQQYLTSGLQWRSGALQVPVTRVSVLRTEMRGAQSEGGQILAHAQTQLALGDAWFVPDLTAEVARLGGESPSAALLGGQAVRVGLAQNFGASDYKLGYFRADPRFNALGSSIAAGESGFALGSSHRLGSGLLLSHNMRLREVVAASGVVDIVHDLVLLQAPAIDGLGAPWQLSARFGQGTGLGPDGHDAISVELAAHAGQWRDWQLDTTVGWYDAALALPLGLPVTGAMWRLSATRHLSIAGFRTRVAPSFALGRSAFGDSRLGARTGLAMGFSQLSDNIDFNVNYLSAGWSSVPEPRGELQMSVSYRQSTTGILSSLRAAVSKLRWPWQRP